jgi:homoserine dehydrogenase
MQCHNLCLLGFGNVARALVRLLRAKTPELRDRYGIDWQITGVATRRLGWLVNPRGMDSAALLAEPAGLAGTVAATNFQEWLRLARPDVVFELTSLEPRTGQPAIDHLRAALDAGAHAITANKGPVVHAYHELRDLAQARGRRFLFEATVMGGGPIFSLFRETLPATTVRRFRAIFNATSNLILLEMEAGVSFEAAVMKAQALGIAETDPSNDVDGWDSAVKVATLATVLMDVPVPLAAVQREGIRGLRPEVVRAARAAGRPFKLVCQAERVGGGVVASVRPEQVPLDDPLASVRGTDLLVHFETDTLHGLTIIEHGSGPDTTAYDVMADFISAVRTR